ncbi:hypothetical protein PILCRDRAFT_820730 [Piloderma croceum F 1598]|uniref:NAD(P)-binding protein n=1 Tax=Piloderma croceum (strain F 1598) TaxID=765440 RepID=A0A0C3BY92_PILCF|nr:hypothetical protein PILCRDRAFT_820730 [Piloderma croceum F 1598]
MPPAVYLVSGANRGIGLGLVTTLARRDNVIVFAGARNPTAAADLHALVQQYPGKVHIVKLTSCDKAENKAVVATITDIAGRLDVVIANAGISNFYGPSLETPIEQMRDHFEVNVVGTLVLFQAAYPLLSASTPSPKFIPITSGAGSITDCAVIPLSVLAYGSSKAALNYLARKLHFESANLICFPINPGGVDTDLAAFASKNDEMMKNIPVISVEDSVKGLLNQIDNSSREKTGGMFMNYDGRIRNWWCFVVREPVQMGAEM